MARPGLPRLARALIYSNHELKPDPACEILISPSVGQARRARFHLTGRLSGLACDIRRSFSLLTSTCGSSLKIRGHVFVSPRPAVSLNGCPLSTSVVRNKSLACPYTGVWTPLVRVGCLVPLSGVFRGTTKVTNRDFRFFLGKTKENGVRIHVFYDLRYYITIHEENLTNRGCFCSLGTTHTVFSTLFITFR